MCAYEMTENLFASILAGYLQCLELAPAGARNLILVVQVGGNGPTVGNNTAAFLGLLLGETVESVARAGDLKPVILVWSVGVLAKFLSLWAKFLPLLLSFLAVVGLWCQHSAGLTQQVRKCFPCF